MNQPKCVVTALALLLAAEAVPAAGRGGEHLLVNGWRLMHSEETALDNPAYILNRNYLTLRFCGAMTLGTFGQNELGLTLPLGMYQALGVGWLFHGTDAYDRVELDQLTGQPVTTGTISDRRNMYTLSYAVNPWRRLKAGINASMMFERFADDEQLNGFGLDAGLSADLVNSPFLGTHTAGLSMLNIVMNWFGESAGTPYARTLTASWSARMFESRFSSLVDFRLKGLGDADGGGLDWSAGVKAGLWMFRFLKAYGLAGFDDEGLDYFGFSGGVNVPLANGGRDFQAMYQYIARDETAVSHSVYALIEIGRHREERHARRIAIRVNTAPMEYFNRAVALFNEGRYWEAYFAFGRVRTEFPDFSMSDWVDLYSARCLEELRMTAAAMEEFTVARVNNQKSSMLPLLTLGLIRTSYRDGDAGAVQALTEELGRSDAADSLKAHAWYLLGQTAMKERRFAVAAQVFEKISSFHPLYPFAQYSRAVAYGETGNTQKMRMALMNAVESMPAGKAQDEIVNKSRVLLAYLYLEQLKDEQGAMVRAVTLLRGVPAASIYYADALSGLAWAALYAQNWNDCIQTGTALMKIEADPLPRAEGALVTGYARLYQKDFNAAAQVLREGAQMLEKVPPSFDEGGAVRRSVAEHYGSVAEAARRFAATPQTPAVLSAIDSLRREQTKSRADLDKYTASLDQATRRSVFAGRTEQLKSDLDFLHAHALNRSIRFRSEKLREKTQEKQDAIDGEIKRLEDEMKKLE